MKTRALGLLLSASPDGEAVFDVDGRFVEFEHVRVDDGKVVFVLTEKKP